MAKVRLYGETSGYVDLKAPDVAGNVTITLPNESGPFATETFVNGAIEDFATETYVDNAVATAGGLVAVKHAFKTDTQVSSSIAAGGNVAVSGLSVSHAVANATNRLIITVFLGTAANSQGYGNVGVAVNDGTNFIAIGNADGVKTRITAGGNVSSGGANYVTTMPSFTFVHTPGAGTKTYAVHVFNLRIFAETLYVNRSQRDLNDVSNQRTASSLIIQEVKV